MINNTRVEIGHVTAFAFAAARGRSMEMSRCWSEIILIIAPISILSEDEWGDSVCLYKACQAATTDGGLFTDAGVNERGENEWQSENDSEMKTVSTENRQELVQTI